MRSGAPRAQPRFPTAWSCDAHEHHNRTKSTTMSIERLDDACDAQAEPWVPDPSIHTYPPHRLAHGDSAWVLAQAVTELAVIRSPALGVTQTLAELHAVVGLLDQGRAFLPEVIADAKGAGPLLDRDHCGTWTFASSRAAPIPPALIGSTRE